MEFSKLNGYDVKDKKAREDHTILQGEVNGVKINLNTLTENYKNLAKQFEALSLTSEVVNSTFDMVDPEKIYINKSDNNWYYYDSDSKAFVIGGEFISEIENPILVDDLEITLKRALFPPKNIAWSYDNAFSIDKLYTGFYFYGGYFINNSAFELNVKFNEIGITGGIDNTIEGTLNPGDKYVLENHKYYTVEVSKKSGEVFEGIEVIQMSSQFNFVSNIFTLDEKMGDIESILDEINGEVI